MCPICQRLFKRPYAVKDHLNGFHGMGEQVVCQFCGKHFKYKTSLYVHMCPEKEKHKRDQLTSWTFHFMDLQKEKRGENDNPPNQQMNVKQ